MKNKLFASFVIAMLVVGVAWAAEKAPSIAALEKSANFSAADKIMEIAGPALSYSDGKRLADLLASLKKEGLRLTQKAKAACRKASDECERRYLEAYEVVSERLKIEKALIESLREDLKRGVEDLKKFLNRGKTPL